MQPLENILKELEEDFESTVALFPTQDWKFFKFGLGGPHKRLLTKLQRKCNLVDQVIFDYFGAKEETASYNKLIVLCLNNGTPNERNTLVGRFRRQIQRMRKVI